MVTYSINLITIKLFKYTHNLRTHTSDYGRIFFIENSCLYRNLLYMYF